MHILIAFGLILGLIAFAFGERAAVHMAQAVIVLVIAFFAYALLFVPA